MSLNIELARHNMIEQQVRPWDVLDARVLEVLTRVHREDYVPAAYKNFAFADVSLPLGHGEVMMKPVLEGRLLQALALTPNDRVLEVGTGSGFITACLASLAHSVVSVEQHADLAQMATNRLQAAGLRNVSITVADAITAFRPNATFDAVVLTGAVYSLPAHMRNWVKPGGRLFAIQGESPAMQAILHTRINDQAWNETHLLETDLPYLSNAEPPKRFSL